jgi:uncharacterized protein (UPF0261 family)
MAIAVVGMLDEREEGLRLIRDTIDKRGHNALLIDTSMGTGAIKYSLKPDIRIIDMIHDRGITPDNVREMLIRERKAVTSAISECLGERLVEIHSGGGLQGIIAVGGATGSIISLPAMNRLPYGLPKLLISSVAGQPFMAKRLSEYYRIRDITVMHSVVDTVGMNPMVGRLMRNGAGAICGMADEYEPIQKDEKPSIALTEFGHCEKGAYYIRELLEKDFSVTSFHATGFGERAAVEMFNQGLFEAFIDLVPSGFSEHILGGIRDAGPDRLDAGIDSERPYIFAPGGFGMISPGRLEERDDSDPLKQSVSQGKRKIHVMDSARLEVRATAEEMETLGREVAKRLNRRKNKELVRVLIPLKGFTAPGIKGGDLYDPESDEAFISAMKENLDPEIKISELDTHINSPEFAKAMVRALLDAVSRK